MSKKCCLLISFVFLFTIRANSQAKDTTSKFTVSGYIDAYYAHYSDSVGTSNFQKFPSVSPRSNQFGLNTAQVTFQYDAEKVRGVATFHYGDIAKSTWSSTFNNIMEAHAGVRLCEKLWLDAGFFRTHFGTEGLLPKENFCSSVSINTYYEPYFETGFRLNYLPTEKLSINIYILNGYNTFEDNNEKKSIGTCITYLLGDKGSVGYTNYLGDDSPQGTAQSHFRIHQNLFLNYQVKKLKMQIGADYCLQQHSTLIGNTTASMGSGVAGLKYPLTDKFAAYGRGEFFYDPDGIMSGVITDSNFHLTGYKLWGATLGAEYKPTNDTYIRIECRDLQMEKNQKIFYWKGSSRSDRIELLMNIGISF